MVNFGYLLVWNCDNSLQSKVTSRIICNPSRPIYSDVQDWREQQQILLSPDACDFYVCLHPDARLRHEHNSPARNQPIVSLCQRGFFTSYHLSERLYHELCNLSHVKPKFSDLLSDSTGWLYQLHRLVLLDLCRLLMVVVNN